MERLPYRTDELLKHYLDTNQLHREQLCLAVLAIDKRFTDVRPRHPRGGPDGGRDIDAIFRDDQRAFGAVGFVNQANDSSEQKRTIKQKFSDDLAAALNANPKPDAFIFFTNLELTVGERDALVVEAKTAGIAHCEIFHRERIRIALDSTDGLAIRFQFLGVPLSEAEQASFFAKWGDDIQSVISTGFQRVEMTLERMLFLQEAIDVLSGLTLSFELDRTYSADEIGHFRAFCYLQLKEPKLKIFSILFGSSDKSNRMRADIKAEPQQPGIKYGISGGQWEQHIDLENNERANEVANGEGETLKYTLAGCSSAIGADPVKFISIRYRHDDDLIRLWPRLTMRDIDQSMLMPNLNKSLADKIKAIHIFSNGYKLQEIASGEFLIDTTKYEPGIPAEFTDEELKDPWVRIRPTEMGSAFTISFADQTPKRLFSSRQTHDSLANRR
jgi:hypothetical protein